MTALVTYLESGEVCSLLGMVRCGDRLVFALKGQDGTVIGATSGELEIYTAPVIPFPCGDQSPLASRRTPSLEPTSFGEGANSNYGDV